MLHQSIFTTPSGSGIENCAYDALWMKIKGLV
jgi:hypothetical protein